MGQGDFEQAVHQPSKLFVMLKYAFQIGSLCHVQFLSIGTMSAARQPTSLLP
jgi:hypothetical protein